MGKASKPISSSKSTSKSDPSTVPKGASQVKVRHILCEKHSRILQAQDMLRQGRKFDEVARELSEDKARQGGDLGWKSRKDIVPAFADAAFALNVGEMTQNPVRTEFGYHLILCEGRK